MSDEVVSAAVAESYRRLAGSDADIRPAVEHFERVLPVVCADWSLTPVAWMSGGVTSPPVLVGMADGTEAVLKIQPPGAQDAAAHVLAAADGDGYVRLLGWDADRGALLTERLGIDLWQESSGLREQVEVIVPLLLRAWRVPLPEGAPAHRKADELLRVLGELGARYGAAAPRARRLAARYAQELAATETVEVVCHGDPHPNNVLRRGDGWALIDVDGFAGERAYDLSVVLRDACHEFELAEQGRAGAGVELLQHGCRLLAELGGADASRVWRWAFTERVTSGLYATWLGYPTEGALSLRTAEAIACSTAMSHSC